MNNYFKYSYNWDYLLAHTKYCKTRVLYSKDVLSSVPIIPHRILLGEKQPLPMTAWKDVREWVNTINSYLKKELKTGEHRQPTQGHIVNQ